jgi:hypothetical protein
MLPQHPLDYSLQTICISNLLHKSGSTLNDRIVGILCGEGVDYYRQMSISMPESLQNGQTTHVGYFEIQDQEIRRAIHIHLPQDVPAIRSHLHPVAFLEQFAPQKITHVPIAIRNQYGETSRHSISSHVR